MSLWRKAMCKIGNHKRLDVIQSFGSGKHVGCPDCKREMAMHDGLEIIVPWDKDFDEMYEFMGYDIQGARAKWLRRRA